MNIQETQIHFCLLIQRLLLKCISSQICLQIFLVEDNSTFHSLSKFMKKQAYIQTHRPLDQALQVSPVSLWDLRLLFLPAVPEDQDSHRCLRLPGEAARQGTKSDIRLNFGTKK